MRRGKGKLPQGSLPRGGLVLLLVVIKQKFKEGHPNSPSLRFDLIHKGGKISKQFINSANTAYSDLLICE